MASGRFDHKALFPQYFPAKTTETSPENAPEGAAYNYSEVTWKSPTESMDEYNRLMAALQKSSSGAISGDQLSVTPWSDWQ